MTDRNPSNFSERSTSSRVLLHQLRELDEFEHDLIASEDAAQPLRISTASSRHAGRTSPRWWISLGGMAVAASLLAVFMMNQPTPSPVDPLANVTPHHNATESAIDHGVNAVAAHASVLLTIVEGSDPATGLPCASCRTVDLVATDGREQTLLAHAEPTVIQDAMNRTCSPSARRVVVVGLSGPAKSLPSNEAQATQLAQCIMAAPGAGSPGGDSNIITNAAAACMPDSVSVRVWAGSR